MIVDEIMTRNPICIAANETLATASELLRELDVRHLPVVENGQLVGMLSDRDLQEVAVRSLGEDPVDGELIDLLDAPVSEIMSSNLASVSPETAINEAIDLIIERRVGALPVIDADGKGVVGILSYVDILRAIRSEQLA